MIYLITLCGLFLTALIMFNLGKSSETIPKNVQFDKLQREYLTVYLLATFGDWLQGPYIYKLYSDYGFREEDIALLYIAGFASSSVFGWLVGHLSDRYGHRKLCISYGLIYTCCCLTKPIPNWYVLLVGRLLGGVSTSIMFSAFEAWYVEEHLSCLEMPAEWLNDTFGKASCYTGLLAITAGFTAHLCAELLGLGAVSPFLFAVPVLLTCSALATVTWREHPSVPTASHQQITSPLHFILFKDPVLLTLGLVQSLFESVVYVFVFSWTPVLSVLDPPLGLVFACFMLACVLGSRVYVLSLSEWLRPTLLLLIATSLAFLSFSSVSVIVAYLSVGTPLPATTDLLSQLCFVLFVLFELSVGLFNPAISYLKSRVVPEEHRASIANWFRMPMNLFTCLSLTFNRSFSLDTDKATSSPNRSVNGFLQVYFLCSVFLLVTIISCLVLQRKYTRRFSGDHFGETEQIHKKIQLRDASGCS